MVGLAQKASRNSKEIASHLQMKILGISAGGHDASVTYLHDTEIVYAAHAERFSKKKNHEWLNHEIIDEALAYGDGKPDVIAWYEKPWRRRFRYAVAGQWRPFFDDPSVKSMLNIVGLGGIPIKYFGHHESHAAAGYYTSQFKDAIVIVADAIGEHDTFTVWRGKDDRLNKLGSITYPHSLGLFYSAFTQRVGLKPNEEEYILMGMASFGEPKYVSDVLNDFFYPSPPNDYGFAMKYNFHRGCDWWRPELNSSQDHYDLAASVQYILEMIMESVISKVAVRERCGNLVLMGGVALNCVNNTRIAKSPFVKNLWIMPNPGDAGSSLGAAALIHKQHLNWKGPYLGTDIEGAYPTQQAIELLIKNSVIGIANGRAEFGPRALGNRSLLADPRTLEIKRRVNEIKHRQQFRPFAPVIMETMADWYFEMPVKSSPYMQFVAPIRTTFREAFPAISHVDGTCRVQTVNRKQHPGLYQLLNEYYLETGCPMLLNTSLNIRGKPLVNNPVDANNFSLAYGVPVL